MILFKVVLACWPTLYIVTFEMKAFFVLAPLIMLYRVVLVFEFVDKNLKHESHFRKLLNIEQYFPVALFIELCKMVLLFSLWMKS